MILLQEKMNSTNWPAPNVWVFISQRREHCSANAEVMGSNPVEVPKFFFGFICNFLNCNYQCDNQIFIKKSHSFCCNSIVYQSCVLFY